jgi:4-hydroxymandelate oxidase
MARAAGAAGTVMVVSTMSNRTLEDIAAAASGPLWFQLYAMKDKELTRSLIQRAEAAGYRALVLTVDTPRMGRRERDMRNGFALPEDLVPANLPRAAAAPVHQREEGASAIARHVQQAFDDALSWETLAWILGSTRLPVVLKGVLTGEDAARAAREGVSGIIVSNHGGRQLDGVPATLDALGEVAEAAGGRAEVFLDGGVRRGTDVLKARALGARAVLVGRPALWGLMARGEAGAAHVLELFRAEIEHAMVLAGRARWDDIDATLVMRSRFFSRRIT